MNEIIDNARFIIEHLHFIRADWFYAFIPLLLFLLLAVTRKPGDKNWTPVIDAQLMPFVLSRSNTGKQRRYPLLLTFIACSLCITALAGPVYKKLPQPVYREQSSLIVVLDLSQSVNASDIKPSRLARAKLELLDILKARKTGQTALIVYAADAFVVTPLTDDNATIANLVPSLETDMMPAQGSRLSIALSKSLSLFEQAGVISGDILLITDDIHPRDESAIKKLTSQGHRLSIFGIGTTEGGPVPVEGGFLKDSSGAIVIPRLDEAKLQRYALLGNGLYTGIQADDSDIEKLSKLFRSSRIEKNTDDTQLDADIWQEEGHWLLLPLLFFAALWSRKGWLVAVIPFALPGLLLITTLHTQPAHADADADAGSDSDAVDTETSVPSPLIDTENLWFSPDQKAMKAFDKGDNEAAARQFNNPEWKASALYRNGDYEAAARILEHSNNANAYYNRANALARLGKYEDAIKAYDKAIEIDNTNEDARYNRELVKETLDKQQDQQQNQQHDQDSDEKNSDDSEQQSQEQNQEDKNSDNKNSEDNSSQQQESEQQESQQDQQQKSSENENSEQQQDQQAEEKQLQQRDEEAEKKEQEQQQSEYEQQQKEQEQEESEQIEHAESEEKPAEVEVNPTEASITEDEKATEQWLKRVPDDPGGLLRRKFYYQYKQVPNQKDDVEPW